MTSSLIKIKNSDFLNKLYNLAFCIQVAIFFSRSTLMGNDHLGRVNIIFGRSCTSLVYLSILMILVKIFLENETGYIYKIISLLLIFLAVSIYIRTDYLEVMATTALILGSKKVDYFLLVKRFFIIGSLLSIVTILLSIFDVIVNIAFYKGGVYTYALGFVYPTDFAAHVFTLSLAYYICKIKQGVSYTSILIWLVITIITYKVTYAKNDVVCMSILMSYVICYKLVKDFKLFRHSRVIKSFYNKVILKLSSLSLIIVSIFTFLLSYFFDGSSNFWIKLNNIFTGRLYFSHEALHLYNINLDGHKVSENGYGGINGINNASHYFFIDQSVIRMFIMYGFIISILFILGYTIKMYKLYLNGTSFLLILFTIFSLYCFIDFRIYDPSYNVFLPIIFASLIDDELIKNRKNRN